MHRHVASSAFVAALLSVAAPGVARAQGPAAPNAATPAVAPTPAAAPAPAATPTAPAPAAAAAPAATPTAPAPAAASAPAAAPTASAPAAAPAPTAAPKAAAPKAPAPASAPKAAAPKTPASPFDALAAAAIPVKEGRALAGLFWAQTTKCTGPLAADDLLRRQCEGVRIARAEANAGRTYFIRADASALSAGAWDPKQAGLPISVLGCPACAQTVEIAGERRYIVTRGGGKVSVAGGALVGPTVKTFVRPFTTEAGSRSWAQNVLPHLRVDLLFKVPAQPTPWEEGGAKGYAVDLVGYRVFDPCDGAVVVAEPAAGVAPVDNAACGGEGAGQLIPETATTGNDAETAAVGDSGGADSSLPERLSPGQISSAMSSVRADVNVCFARYGIRGTAYLTMEIAGEGKVKDVKLRGDFEDSPTGDCIVGAVRGASFPKFRAASMTIKDFPFILR